jgi:tetratricopeptide (TPR) repeat protein
MEPDLLQVAKDAHVTSAVPDLLTLEAYVPLAKAETAFKQVAFENGHYQDVISLAQSALAIKADFAPAYYGIGISYARLGQWDQAVSNLQAALKIDKNYADAKSALKWAENGQKAVKDGKVPKDTQLAWD